MTDLSGGIIGLSLLSGSDAFASLASSAAATTIESRAQRKAKAAFTAPVITPPWKATTKPAAESVQLSAIKAMKTIIDPPDTSLAKPLTADIQTTLTTYKALDRLQLLASTAAKDTTGTAERAQLQKLFAKGLADLKTYLAAAPSDAVDLSFARVAAQAKSAPVAAPSTLTASQIRGTGVVDTRDAPLTALTGKERFRINLSSGTAADSVTVDLSAGPQPPTLDGIADQINAAIGAVPRLDANGQPVLDASGKPVPRWQVTATPAKNNDKWGLSFDRAGFETIAIDQIGAGDTVLVASGVTGAKTPTEAKFARLDDPAGAMERTTLGGFTTVDGDATERLKALADADTTGKTKAVTVNAAVGVRGVATDAQGFSYVVGTSAGDVGGNLSDGGDDLLLTKLDSEGKTVWQRTLGAAGTAQGAAVTIAPDGGIVVAGTVTGSFDGAKSDGDLLVARFDTRGEETFSSLSRSVGVDAATAVVVGADGSIFVGGTTHAGADAVVTRFDAKGVQKDSRVIDSGGTDAVKALAVGTDGKLLVLTGEKGNATLRRIDQTDLSKDLAKLDLGKADARAIAVSSDGGIAVVGGTDGAVTGTQVNTRAAGRDAFVARIDPALSDASVTYIGGTGDDQADSASFLGNTLYVGGRTASPLSGARTGDVDAFVARIDSASGTLGNISQFGTIGAKTEPVQISAIAGGDSALGALGLHRGTLTPTDAVSLEAQTSLRTGDQFSIRVNGGALRKVTIQDGDTLTTLADRVRKLIGTAAGSVTTLPKGTGRALGITVKPGNEIQFVAGAAGQDALGKLGLDARRISSPAPLASDAPKVRPGGDFGLDLSEALRIDTKADAAAALGRVKQSVSFSQSAFRSLYWDDTKAALVDAPTGNGRAAASTAIEKGQLANYQAALTRLSSGTTSSYGL